MPKPTKGPRLGGSPTHERIILRNLATQLFEHGRITTTETKARRVQPLAEKLITKAKRGDLHSRRLVLQSVTDPAVVRVLFDEIAPAVAEREGGYTRITKLGPRKGDNAPMAMIEVITEAVAAGLPILYCDDRLETGLSDATSLLTGPGVEELAEGIRRLCDPELRGRMSAATEGLIEQLSPQLTAERYVQVYQEAIAKGRAERG